MYKIILFMIMSNALYGFDSLEVVNLNGIWQNNKGEFTGDRLKVYTEQFGLRTEGLSIPLKREGGKYSLSFKGLDFIYKPHPSSVLNGIENLMVDQATLIYKPKELLQFSTKGITIAQGQGQQSIPKMSVRCKALPQGKSTVLDLIHPCLDVGAVEIPLLRLNSFSNKAVAQALNTKSSIDKLEEVKVNIYKKRFTASLKAKFIFRLTVKVSGPITYDQNNEQMVVQVEKATAGIFPVKRTLLKEIREANLDSIKVVGDRLFIKL